jgi:molybdenum cofactor guanylyltransferase
VQIVGVILAGGAGRRLGGVDKARVNLGGRWLARHVADRIAPQVAALAIVAQGDSSRLAPLGLPVLADGLPGQLGPLAGVLAGLDWAATQGADAVLSVSVDTPFLPGDLVAALADAMGNAMAAVSVAGDRRHPTCALWRVELREVLREALLGGLRKVDGFAQGIGASEARFPAADMFFNINTLAELDEAEGKLAARQSAAFDRIVIVDWSARAAPSPRKPSADAIWVGVADADGTFATYHRTRAGAEAAVGEMFEQARKAGQRLLAGFDFPFGYPAGFAARVTGQAGAPGVWDWLDAQITDTPENANNRFDVACALNAMFEMPGPFWGRPANLTLAGLCDRKDAIYGPDLAERRLVETQVRRAQPVWKLYTTGSVGSQALLGLPMIARLRRRFGATVWPFDGAYGPLVLAEIYPSIIDGAVRAALGEGVIKDEVQVRLLARAFWNLQAQGGLADAFAAAPDWPGRGDEGWILGVGVEDALRDQAAASSPRPRNSASTPGIRPRKAV